jgi:hypothetical protein
MNFIVAINEYTFFICFNDGQISNDSAEAVQLVGLEQLSMAMAAICA